jgi:hypothetical protein
MKPAIIFNHRTELQEHFIVLLYKSSSLDMRIADSMYLWTNITYIFYTHSFIEMVRKRE